MAEDSVRRKDKTPRESFLTEKLPTLIAITTVILAVCATLASFKAAGYGNKMVLAQSRASDQWAYYQAKSIKETVFQLQRDTVQIMLRQSTQPDYYVKIAQYDREISRYNKEKNDIIAQAQSLERERDKAQGFNSRFGQVTMFLQVGILMSSLAAITKTRLYWYISLVSGGAGVTMFLYTLYLSW